MSLAPTNAYVPTSRTVVVKRLAFLFEAWGWRWNVDGTANGELRVPDEAEIRKALDSVLPDMNGSDPSLRSEIGGIMLTRVEDWDQEREVGVYLRVGTL